MADFFQRKRVLRLTDLFSNRLTVPAIIAAMLMCGHFRDCLGAARQGQGIIGSEQQGAVASALLGEWLCVVGHKKIVFKLTPEGDFNLGDQKGRYVLEGSTVRLATEASQISYQFELAANELTLSGGDLTQPLKFTRTRSVSDYEDWLSYLSPKSLASRLKRIAIILLIAVGCRVLLLLLRGIIHLVIYCDRGPLAFVYRHHKSRTMTMYSLFINLSKYVVYLVAAGFVLSELGVNYTAYLASLSVVGLAIGFGSQGLVQDMVTGFFIVFEEQFNVGDMVEIPPHVGLVQELGLRMTRVRNYLGQQVVIPNRNIAAVGNYVRGAQHVNIDVAAAGREAAKKAQPVLMRVVRELARQFEEVIISFSETSEIVSLATDECFVRLSVAIWPQQQWVVEQEMVPRIRSVLGSEGLEVPNDRVTVFYHPRQQQPVRSRKRIPSKTDKRPEATGK